MTNPEKTNTSWICRDVAAKINCADLHKRTQERLMTSNISIRIAPGVEGARQMILKGAATLVPNSNLPLSDFCEEPWDDFCICITYKQDGYLPTDVMTRAEFLVQTLDIWDAMHTRLETLNKTVAEELMIASAHLRGCYHIAELMDIGSTIAEIDTMGTI